MTKKLTPKKTAVTNPKIAPKNDEIPVQSPDPRITFRIPQAMIDRGEEYCALHGIRSVSDLARQRYIIFLNEQEKTGKR